MKMKQLLVLGLGVVIGGGLSVAGLSYASASNKPEVKTQVESKSNAKSLKSITEEKAKSIMLGKVSGATISEFEYDMDDNKYEGTLIKDNYKYEADINAQTGDIIAFEKEAINTSNKNDDRYDDKHDNDNDDRHDNNKHNNTTNNNQSNNNQSKNNNQVSTLKSNTNTNTNISASEARSIMLQRVPGATISEFEFDNDNTPEYEAELVKGNFEYDITVDAKTGQVTEFSKEYIDHNDDNDNDKYDHNDMDDGDND